MKVNAISFNHTGFYNILDEDKQFIKEIRSTFIYDPELGVHLCELTPSHELRYLHTYIVWDNDPSEEERAQLEEHYCHEGSEDMYMHISDVRQLIKNDPTNHKECGEFEDIEEACEYLNGNWPF